jgi:hypothetical protein
MKVEARGHNGQVSFDGRFVTIARQGVMARMSVGKGEQRIPVKAITAVRWTPPGAFNSGSIHFTIAGVESRSRPMRAFGDSVHDENTVIFLRKQMPAFEVLRSAIEEAMYELPDSGT